MFNIMPFAARERLLLMAASIQKEHRVLGRRNEIKKQMKTIPFSVARALRSMNAAASGEDAKAAIMASFIGGGFAAVCSSRALRSTAAPVSRALRMPWSSRSWLRAAADARMPECTEAIPPSGSCGYASCLSQDVLCI